MLGIAVCDDDPAITGFMEATLKGCEELLPEPLDIQVFHEGAAVLAALKKDSPFDIIFLDIELGDTTGMEVAEQIRKQFAEPALIFVSAHESYCKQLFQYDTTAFLEKPIDEAEVKALLLQVYKKIRNPQQMYIYQFKDDIVRIPLGDILFFESKMHKIELVTKTESRIFNGKLDEVEQQLKHPGFVRIHQSLLVNLDNVVRFEKNILFLPGGHKLPMSRPKQKEVRRKIMDYYTGSRS
jgi:DNA-binding LytR/AlgR family response regulator